MSSNEPVKNGCEVIYEMFHNYIELQILKYMKHFIYHFTKMFTFKSKLL